MISSLHTDTFSISDAVVPMKLRGVSGCPDVRYACTGSITAFRRRGKVGGCAAVTKLEVH